MYASPVHSAQFFAEALQNASSIPGSEAIHRNHECEYEHQSMRLLLETFSLTYKFLDPSYSILHHPRNLVEALVPGPDSPLVLALGSVLALEQEKVMALVLDSGLALEQEKVSKVVDYCSR